MATNVYSSASFLTKGGANEARKKGGEKRNFWGIRDVNDRRTKQLARLTTAVAIIDGEKKILRAIKIELLVAELLRWNPFKEDQ